MALRMAILLFLAFLAFLAVDASRLAPLYHGLALAPPPSPVRPFATTLPVVTPRYAYLPGHAVDDDHLQPRGAPPAAYHTMQDVYRTNARSARRTRRLGAQYMPSCQPGPDVTSPVSFDSCPSSVVVTPILRSGHVMPLSAPDPGSTYLSYLNSLRFRG